jgi:DNA-binding transcriptional LysR family regulator
VGATPDLDWDDLKYFLAAMRAGSLSGAAHTLGVTHSTIGRRLAALENALGAPLFDRSASGLGLAPLGERLLPLVEEIERMSGAIAALATTAAAKVRLAVPSGFSRMLGARLGGFHRRNPEIALEILSGSRPVDLMAGEAELALRVGPITGPDLVARKIATSGWSLYASHGYLETHPASIDLSDLRGHQVIGFDQNLERAPGALWLREHGAGATVVLKLREITEMVAAAVGGAGLAVIPCHPGDAEPTLVRVTPEVLGSHSISLVYRRDVMLSPAVRKVRQFVVDVIREHAGALSGLRRRKASS